MTGAMVAAGAGGCRTGCDPRHTGHPSLRLCGRSSQWGRSSAEGGAAAGQRGGCDERDLDVSLLSLLQSQGQAGGREEIVVVNSTGSQVCSTLEKIF